MVSEQWLFQAIESGKTYDSLPNRIKNSVSLAEWKAKVKQYSIQHGFSWADSIAHTSGGEQEYYEDLLEYYKKNERVRRFFCHYICRILRFTAFRYYSDILFNSLKEEKAYDKIPNFTAADILRHLGIGRNEYISILNACRAKKFIWRMNRNIAKERLPNEPVSMVMEPWWKIGVVNLTENEYRSLTTEELEFLQNASDNDNALSLGDVNYEMLRTLYRRGLVYLRIPIRDDDRFTIPPLEGFISNRNVSGISVEVDPMEMLLYSVFIANSENMPLSSLANVLNRDIAELKFAMGIAVRQNLQPITRGTTFSSDGGSTGSLEALQLRENDEEEDAVAERLVGNFPTEGTPGDIQSIAILVDAETTSFLMMGVLSSGIKRHAVTLFEGGRVSGEEVISHLISELRSSANAKEQDEEIRKLMKTASALADLLECVKEASGSGSIELLRRESLQGLSSEAVTRLLSHSYNAVVPIAPLSGEPLPLNAAESPPLFFGPTGAVASIWFQLACYVHLGCGPISYVFLRGQRVKQLPMALRNQTYALLTPFPFCQAPHLVSFPFVLHYLNELCRHGHVLLQPLFVEDEKQRSLERLEDLDFVDVPLPFVSERNADNERLFARGFKRVTGTEAEIPLSSEFSAGLTSLGLTNVAGFLRFSRNCSATGDYVPFSVSLGIPLEPLALCHAVCSLVREKQLLDPAKAVSVIADKTLHAATVQSLLDKYGHTGAGMAPRCAFVFDGKKLAASPVPNDALASPVPPFDPIPCEAQCRAKQ